MSSLKFFRNVLLGALLLATRQITLAQTTATWTGASGGAWNTAGNWDIGVPGVGTNALINAAVTVNYNSAMLAASISNLVLSGAANLNVNAGGFNVESGNTGKNVTIGVTGSSGTLNINAGGALTLTNSGQLYISTNGLLVVNTGGTLLITNTLNSSDALLVGDNRRLASATSRARLQVSGGTVTIDKRVTIAGSTSASTAGAGSEIVVDSGILNLLGGGQINNTTDDGACRFLINGGTVGLGNFNMTRSSTAPATGLVISNGVVNATAIQVGTSASRAYAAIYGGVLTNTGIFHVSDTSTAANSGDRKAHFQVFGGTVVSTIAEGIVMGYQQNATAAAASVFGGSLELSGGTLFANGITLVKDNTIANAYGALTMSGNATAYLGSVGLVGNAGAGGSGYTVTLSGGTLGATADHTNNANMTLNGTITVQAADVSGTPHDVYANGIWSGTGGLTKTGNGTLTLDAGDTYSGITAINAGTLALGASGSLNNSSQIILASGTKLDTSAASGFTIPAGKTLAGLGAVLGDVAFGSTAALKPGSNTVAGTLTFSNSLTQSGGVDNQFDLSTNPSGPNNDLVVVGGDINLSGGNGLTITGGGPAGSLHPLFKYGGNLNGSIASFTVTGPTGFLTNITSVTPKMIAFVVASTIRAATNVTWVGNAVNNDWDTLTTTNWLNNGALDFFVSADNVLFSGVGQANSNVVVNSVVSPASVSVNSAGDYSISGSGAIGGTGGLTKTNSGTLVVATANTYTGPTTINGGTLEVSTLANGDVASPIGKSSVASANLVIGSGSLRYTGGNGSTDHGVTIAASNSVVDVTNAATTLTISGAVTGGGTLNKAGAGTLILSGGNSQGATTVSNGTLQVNSAISAIGTGPVNFAGGTLRLNVSSQQTYVNALNVLNNSSLISAGGNNNIIQAPWSGAANLNVELGSGTFTINANMTTNFTGTIVVSDSSSGFFRFNAGGNGSSTQQSSGSAAAAFDLGNSTVTLLNRNGGAAAFGIYNLGALAGGPGTFLRGAANGGGAINASFYSIGAKGLNTTFAGTIANGTGGSGATTAIIKVGSGVLTLTGNNPYTGSTTVSNGVLALGDGVTDGFIGNSPLIDVLGGAVLDVSKLSTTTLSLGGNQTLKGNGTIRGSVDSSGGGTLSPGGSIGTLTVTNVATLGGNLVIELNRANGAQTNDVLKAASIVLGGTLTVTNVGPSLVAGDRFVLLNGAVSGSFGTLTLPSYYTWNTSQLNVDGSITVTGVVPPPTITSVDYSAFSSGTLQVSASGGLANGAVSVLTSTNLTLPLNNWTLASSTAFDPSGNVTATIAVDPAAPQLFIRLQAQ
jgi:autotransporter-associated beta strand protein